MQLYPEIYSCVGCNACTKSCTQGLNVMQYIAYAQRGEYEKCAEESFRLRDVRRMFFALPRRNLPSRRSRCWRADSTGKYLAPKREHLDERVEEITRRQVRSADRRSDAEARRRDQGALQPPRDREVRRERHVYSIRRMLRIHPQGGSGTRGKHQAASRRRMTAEEKDEFLLKLTIPTTHKSQFAALEFGPNKGEKVPHELCGAAGGHSPACWHEESICPRPDYDVDVLIIGGGGAGASAAIEADNGGRQGDDRYQAAHGRREHDDGGGRHSGGG